MQYYVPQISSSAVYRSTQEQLTRCTEYFAEVFSGDFVTPDQQQHMEQLIAQLENLLAPSAASTGSSGDDCSSSTAAVAAAAVVALLPYRR
jgi:hypothetical protein